MIIFVWHSVECPTRGKYLINSSHNWTKDSNYVVNFLSGKSKFLMSRAGALELVRSISLYILILLWIDLLVVFLGVSRTFYPPSYIDSFRTLLRK